MVCPFIGAITGFPCHDIHFDRMDKCGYRGAAEDSGRPDMCFCPGNGAAYVTRTRDPVITNDVLYQLS